MDRKKKVAYFYDPDLGGYYYGPGHPMKPHRVRMAHALVLRYGLANMMEVYRPRPATPADARAFHTPDYVDFLTSITPAVAASHRRAAVAAVRQYAHGDDCPIFPGLWPYCALYTGGSVGGAVKLNQGGTDVAINWAGGLHHAHKGSASGFCYVNDIVLAILELLKHHARVLYVDIDVHHGDGVEEAFLTTDRVLTVSFHKFGGGFFPGTGSVHSVGAGAGTFYSLNAPLRDGMSDGAYAALFRPVLDAAVARFDPSAIVVQCGADSLAGDRLGPFNLSSAGHAAALAHCASYGRPTLVLGGGGYKIANVARCWAAETGALLGVPLDETIPEHEFSGLYGEGEGLSVKSKPDMDNANTPDYLASLKEKLLRHIASMGAAPSPPLGGERPPDAPVEAVAASRPLWDAETDAGEDPREREAEGR